MRWLLPLAFIGGLIPGTYIGATWTLATVDRAEREVVEAHAANDAHRRVKCAMADVAWQRWRDRATRKAVALYDWRAVLPRGAK